MQRTSLSLRILFLVFFSVSHPSNSWATDVLFLGCPSVCACVLEQRHFLTVDFCSSCMLASLEAVHRCVISDVWMYIYRQRDICITCIVDDVSVSSICSIDSPLSSSVTPSLFYSRLYLPFLLILPTSLFFFRTEDWPTCCAAYFPLNSWLSFQRLCRLLWG